MPAKHISTRLLAALVVLALVAATCVSLGNWQLDRAAERDAIAQAIEAGRQRAPLQLSTDTGKEQLQEWRSAQATGTWLPQFTVLLDNRNYNGRPGLWVATPLQLQESNTALLVLRGWIPRPVAAGETLPDLAPPAGEHTISGQLRQRVPRLFELWTFGGADPNALPAGFANTGSQATNGSALQGNPPEDQAPPASVPPEATPQEQPLRVQSPQAQPPRVQNLDLAHYGDATGLKLLPVVLEQTSAEAAGANELVQDWPLPPTDSDTNRGYALQWFSFAAIAIGAWIAIAWRALRKRRPKPDTID